MSRTALTGINFNTECISFFDFVHISFFDFVHIYFFDFFRLSRKFRVKNVSDAGSRTTFRGKNPTDAGSRTTSEGKTFLTRGPERSEGKTPLTRGPERPFRCLDWRKTLLHTQTGKREIESHLTRQCCHLLSVGWLAMEEDGKGTWSSDCEQDFLELLLHRFHCWQLSGISEKIWGIIFSVDRWPTSSSVVSESP